MVIATEHDIEDLDETEEDEYDLVVTRQDQVEHETAKAVKIVLDGVASWVPRSAMRQNHRGLWVASWFVEKEGLDVD